MVLCDTNIIIEFFKGNHKTLKEIEQIGFDNIAISAITVMELYYGALNKKELHKIKKCIYSLNVHQIDSYISEIAIELIEEYSKSHNLMIPDAIIAATAILQQIEIFTYNIKDFHFIKELKLYTLANL